MGVTLQSRIAVPAAVKVERTTDRLRADIEIAIDDVDIAVAPTPNVDIRSWSKLKPPNNATEIAMIGTPANSVADTVRKQLSHFEKAHSPIPI